MIRSRLYRQTSSSLRTRARVVGQSLSARPLRLSLDEDLNMNEYFGIPQPHFFSTIAITRNPSITHKNNVSCTRRHKVFVSRHNNSLQLTAANIIEYLQSQNVGQQPRLTGSHVICRECPFCAKPTKGLASNLYKLYISIGGGAYFCHRCGSKGSWYDLKAELGGYEVVGGLGRGENSTSVGISNSPSTAIAPLPMPQPRINCVYSSLLLDAAAPDNNVLQYLVETRGLKKETLRKYGVGRATYKFPTDSGSYESSECVSFPWMMRESDVATQEALRGAIVEPEDAKKKSKTKGNADANIEAPTGKFVTRRIKLRSIEHKAWQRLDPPGGGWGLFGLHTVPDDATEIVITEGEYDAMAVYQATGRPAVSLPNGCRSLPVQVLPLLERFSKVYLWMDNDGPGQEGAEQFAKKIGLNRCYMVKCREAKDANDALREGLDMEKMIQEATVVPHERILTFADLRSEVLHEMLHPDMYTGVPITSLPGFTKLVKGFRRGELTVLTGPTGSGKTTFLGQVSLDMAEQGINVLWGSFEIKNTRLLHKLLQQFSRSPLPKGDIDTTKLEALADRFETLPLFFMKFHGGSDVDDVLDAMEYAVYVNDVEHIILDNMQFMISRNGMKSGSSFDKFDVQDMAIEKFRKFATEHNIHLTLVVHPRKEDETAKLNISSFYGSAKATQEADTVIILQSDGRRKYIEVKKNRFDGTLGYSPLHFHRDSGRYVEDEQGPAGQKIDFKHPQQQSQGFQYGKQAKEKEVTVLENFWDGCLDNGGTPQSAA